ncbi:MAG TPA: CAP domain-containing protein [Pyrinomonadaceae bacterium]|jgi:uncharacterized protein YkwD|nr:CAP domain-containing protein [Pyrinomonadaceae bacterium]
MKRFGFVVSLLACLSVVFFSNHSGDARASNGPAKSAVSYAALEQELISEINLARTRPSEYAAYLEALRPMFAGKEYRRPGKSALLTEEGAVPLEEAIKFLRAAKPLSPLSVATGMCSGARALVTEQSTSGATGHKGADGSFCEQRTERFGAWREPIGENLNYSDDSARERVFTLLIDDGVANRGHRQRILNPGYKVVGVACGQHKLGSLCVITFAGGFTDKPAARAQSTPAQKSTAPSKPAGAKRF